jgi:hypothetical protein
MDIQDSKKQKKVEINGKEYLLQNPGARWYARHNDSCMTKNGLSTEKYITGLLEHVVIDPVVKFEDFDFDFGTLEELVATIEGFFRGR